ncbi:MAG TPA: YgiQ family radical SAM protein [Bacteroidales bacterium]|nr:YgiQ family radical SAM protein [Bacteroidales bacterium]
MAKDKYNWLPITADEVKQRGWEYIDVIIISGDSYVDHPAFGTAVIGRVIENAGYRVAIIAQPDWRNDLRDFKKFGAPRLFFGVTAGCVDSMVNNYTANKRRRSDDAYTAGNKAGFRPDYAIITYTQILKKLYPEIPVVIGGIEASLRRLTHYDYWSNQLMPSILVNSKADLLIYGMGEQPIIELLNELKSGKNFKAITNVYQTAFIYEGDYNSLLSGKKYKEIPSHENCIADKRIFAKMFVMIEEEAIKMEQNILVQKVADKTVIINPPFPLPAKGVIDFIYDLPYTRLPHPKYKKRGIIPAYEMIKFSITSHRGCFGGCSFCAITCHQGKFVTSRTEKSIIKEIENIVNSKEFKGTITDIGGPTANMYNMYGIKTELCQKCKRVSCLYPDICKNLNYDHKPLINIYKKVLSIPKVKHLYIGSGIRYDMLVGRTKGDNEKYSLLKYLELLVSKHISGRFKVAPEHTSNVVLKNMRKADFNLFKELLIQFKYINAKYKLNQQIVPYFISAHPGCSIKEMAELAIEMKKLKILPQQVQTFTPTPMTLSSVMYYCEFSPYNYEKIYVAKTIDERKEQHKFFFWYLKENKISLIKSLNKIKEGNLLKNKLFNNNNYAKK